MITVYTFNKNTVCVCVRVCERKRETTYLNPEYSQTSYALLKKKKALKNCIWIRGMNILLFQSVLLIFLL